MTDLFEDKAKDWDTRPVPLQISQGVFDTLQETVSMRPEQTVLDFGAGTGLVCGKLAPHVGRVLAVDVSQSMLDQLAQKPELKGKVETFCQDILERPLDEKADLIVSAMAMHHVEDTQGLFRALFAHLRPGGQIALADLDTEAGDFHPAGIEGVFHHGFDREALGEIATQAGFVDPAFVTACEVDREGKSYPVFLLTAKKPD